MINIQDCMGGDERMDRTDRDGMDGDTLAQTSCLRTISDFKRSSLCPSGDLIWAGEMAQRVRLSCKPVGLSSILRTHMVGEKNELANCFPTYVCVL